MVTLFELAQRYTNLSIIKSVFTDSRLSNDLLSVHWAMPRLQVTKVGTFAFIIDNICEIDGISDKPS